MIPITGEFVPAGFGGFPLVSAKNIAGLGFKNITEFAGVDPTGTTDSSAAVIAGLAALPADVALVIPPGTILNLDSNVSFESVPVIIHGAILRPGLDAQVTLGPAYFHPSAQVVDFSRTDIAHSSAIKFKIKAGITIGPRFFGGIGNESHDDTVALQDYFDAMALTEIDGCLTQGRWVATDTIDLTRAATVSGKRYRTDGAGFDRNNTYAQNSKQDWSTKIRWEGAAGGTVLKFGGSGCTFEPFTIVGGTNRPAIGFHLYKLAGVDSGRSFVPSIAMVNCDYAWQCGTLSTDGNCDNMLFGQLYAQNCGSAYRVVNDQGQLHNFDFLHCVNVTTALDFDRGGPCRVGTLYGAYIGTLLKVAHGGISVSNYTIEQVKLDAQSNGRVIWVQDLAGNCNITIQSGIAIGLWNQRNTGVAAFQIANNTVLTVKNVEANICMPGSPLLDLNVTTGASVNQHPKATFENCLIGGIEKGIKYDVDPDTTAIVTMNGTSGPTKYYSLSGCYRDTTQHIPIGEIGNFKASRGGSTIIPDGQATVTIDHKAFGANPSSNVLPQCWAWATESYAGGIGVENITATQADIRRNGSTSGALHVDYRVLLDPATSGQTFRSNLLNDPSDFSTANWVRSPGSGAMTVVFETDFPDPDNPDIGRDGWTWTDSADGSAVQHTLTQTIATLPLGVETTFTVRLDAALANSIQYIALTMKGATVRATWDIQARSLFSHFNDSGNSLEYDAASQCLVLRVTCTPTLTTERAMQIRMQTAGATTTYQGAANHKVRLFSATVTQAA